MIPGLAHLAERFAVDDPLTDWELRTLSWAAPLLFEHGQVIVEREVAARVRAHFHIFDTGPDGTWNLDWLFLQEWSLESEEGENDEEDDLDEDEEEDEEEEEDDDLNEFELWRVRAHGSLYERAVSGPRGDLSCVLDLAFQTHGPAPIDGRTWVCLVSPGDVDGPDDVSLPARWLSIPAVDARTHRMVDLQFPTFDLELRPKNSDELYAISVSLGADDSSLSGELAQAAQEHLEYGRQVSQLAALIVEERQRAAGSRRRFGLYLKEARSAAKQLIPAPAFSPLTINTQAAVRITVFKHYRSRPGITLDYIGDGAFPWALGGTRTAGSYSLLSPEKTEELSRTFATEIAALQVYIGSLDQTVRSARDQAVEGALAIGRRLLEAQNSNQNNGELP